MAVSRRGGSSRPKKAKGPVKPAGIKSMFPESGSGSRFGQFKRASMQAPKAQPKPAPAPKPKTPRPIHPVEQALTDFAKNRKRLGLSGGSRNRKIR